MENRSRKERNEPRNESRDEDEPQKSEMDRMEAFTNECIERIDRAIGKHLKKKKKDPNAPQRTQSGYMIWLKTARKGLTKPGMSVTDVAKAAGVVWKAMPTDEKSGWVALAAEDKLRYEREMAKYKARA